MSLGIYNGPFLPQPLNMLLMPKNMTSRIIVACGQQIRMILALLNDTYLKITKIIRAPSLLDYFQMQILHVKLSLQIMPENTG